MCVLVSRPMKIATFPRKNGETPKWVVDFLREWAHSETNMEIFEDFPHEAKNLRNLLRFIFEFLFIFIIFPSVFSCFLFFFFFFMFLHLFIFSNFHFLFFFFHFFPTFFLFFFF